jgi:membrane protease YdiL (CAAX protease family)
MTTLSRFIKQYALAVYFILAYVFAWIFYPLIMASPVYGLPGLFAPALAAIIVTWAVGGWSEVGKLLRKLAIWRVGLIWYVIALGLPVLLSFLVAFLGRFFGGDPVLELAPITPLSIVVFVLVVGEELGWRGYAQPQLEKSYLPLISALILGVLWGFWHLPNFFIPGLPHYGVPLAAFVLYTIGLSVLAAWLLNYTRGSVLLATLFHSSTNTFGFLTPGLEIATRWWLIGAVYCAAGLLVAIIFGVRLSRFRSTEHSEAMQSTRTPTPS